jgi:hypothetical protein
MVILVTKIVVLQKPLLKETQNGDFLENGYDYFNQISVIYENYLPKKTLHK